MSTVGVRIALVVLAVLASGSAAHAKADYVPDAGWSDEWHVEFYENWFGKQLRAMREPSFARPLEASSDLETRYRVTVIPTFRPAYAIRVDVKKSGKARVRWTALDGQGGYAPGEVASAGGRGLAPAEWARLLAIVRAASLEDRPMEDPGAPESEDGTTFICMDGTAWLIERVDASGRIFLERRFCGYPDRPLSEMIEAFVDLLPDRAIT